MRRIQTFLRGLFYLSLQLKYILTSVVISIDFGNEMRLCMLKTGAGYDVVLNNHSKDESPASIAIVKDEVIFGAQSSNMVRISNPS
jgi:hypothetical protein